MKYFLLTFSFNNATAQKTYRINYSQYIQSSVTINGESSIHMMNAGLLFNDTLSFYYLVPLDSRDKFKKMKLLGDKLAHHAVMYNRNTDEVLYEVAWPDTSYFVIVDSSTNYDWIFNATTKDILGYKCNIAYSISPGNDTLLVWYTNKLGSIFGPSDYFGLPGIVLEVFDQKHKYHLLATKVEESATILVLPDVKKISSKEYRGQQKKIIINKYIHSL